MRVAVKGRRAFELSMSEVLSFEDVLIFLWSCWCVNECVFSIWCKVPCSASVMCSSECVHAALDLYLQKQIAT